MVSFVPGTGTLLITKAPYRNSSFTEIKGVDLDIKQRVRLGDYGRATFGLTWTHIASWVRAESATVRYQYAGTHGNCDTSNCAGTPKDKINLTGSWDMGNWNLSGIVNYRSEMKNILFEGDLCASHLANGSRCAERLQTGLVHHARPVDPLERQQATATVRIDQQRDRQDRAARSADLWRHELQPDGCQRRDWPLLQGGRPLPVQLS